MQWQCPWQAKLLKRAVNIMPRRLRGHAIKHLDPLIRKPCIDSALGVPFPYASDLTEASMLYGNYERDDWRVAQRLLRPGDVVIDIGANIGWYSAVFAGAVQPSGAVYAVEPFPRNIARLESFRALLPIPELVQIFEGAISDHSGRADLFLNKYDAGHSLIEKTEHVAFTGETLNIEVTTLDDFASTHGLHDTSLIKIDVEGAELQVVSGGLSILRHTSSVMIEISGVGLTEGLKVHEMLVGLGFKGYVTRKKSTRLEPYLPQFLPPEIQRNVFYCREAALKRLELGGI